MSGPRKGLADSAAGAEASHHPDVEWLSVFIHGILAACHCLCFWFHIRKRQFGHAALHGVVLGYDLLSVRRHARRLTRKTNEHPG